MGSRPLFCGNFEYDARQSEIERLFDRYGRIARIDMKTGFAFVYMEDDRDAEDAIRDLDSMEFGRQRRRLRVQWAKGEGPVKAREEERKNAPPNKTLFVVNFDPINTRTRDLERHFEAYGKLERVQIRKNFAFVQFETVEEAVAAVKGTNGTNLDGRQITVEYAAKDDGQGRFTEDGDRGRDRDREDRDREDRDRDREDRDRDRGRDRDFRDEPPRRRSPEYGRYRSRSPPRRYRSRSPDYQAYRR